MFGYGVMTAVIMSAYNFTGGSLRGYKKDKEIDDFERKEALRLNRRRPIEQTVSELGEGRGMYAVLLVYSMLMWSSRYLRTWICGAEGSNNQGELRNRRQIVIRVISGWFGRVGLRVYIRSQSQVNTISK